MSWYFNNKVFSENDIRDYVGFVYLITELDTYKLYIGQKVFYNKVAKKPLKGMKNKRRSKKYSNWNEYYGSNELLKEQVQLKGIDNYRREILFLCKSKSEMNYREAKEIFVRDALLHDNYYNNWISTRIQRNTLKFNIND